MIIRKATNCDLETIELIHKTCFPDNFSSCLAGKKWHILANFYKEYLNAFPNLFFVAEEDNNIVGFCMGYLNNKSDIKKSFLRNNFFHIIIKYLLLLLAFNKLAWKKTLSFIFKTKKTVYYTEQIDSSCICGDLLSICILEKYRGTGGAQSLVDAFIKELSKQTSFCFLSVQDGNGRAIQFYKKNGFIKYKKVKKIETVYLKMIN